jgi:hypothetical protein
MSRRLKHFELAEANELELYMEFGTYVLMMYYIAQIDYQKALKLFHATISEWKYRVEYELDEGMYDSENYTCHFVPTEIQESIAFIDNQVIPALGNETYEDILVKYGCKANFENIYNDNNTFLIFLGVYDEEYDDSKYALRENFRRLKNVFQESLNRNIPFKTWVW